MVGIHSAFAHGRDGLVIRNCIGPYCPRLSLCRAIVCFATRVKDPSRWPCSEADVRVHSALATAMLNARLPPDTPKKRRPPGAAFTVSRARPAPGDGKDRGSDASGICVEGELPGVADSRSAWSDIPGPVTDHFPSFQSGRKSPGRSVLGSDLRSIFRRSQATSTPTKGYRLTASRLTMLPAVDVKVSRPCARARPLSSLSVRV